jgi:hypothetical protein
MNAAGIRLEMLFTVDILCVQRLIPQYIQYNGHATTIVDCLLIMLVAVIYLLSSPAAFSQADRKSISVFQ